jgi:hypothetical protein
MEVEGQAPPTTFRPPTPKSPGHGVTLVGAPLRRRLFPHRAVGVEQRPPRPPRIVWPLQERLDHPRARLGLRWPESKATEHAHRSGEGTLIEAAARQASQQAIHDQTSLKNRSKIDELCRRFPEHDCSRWGGPPR